MSPFVFLKTTMGDAHLLPPGGIYARRSCSINFHSFATAYGNKGTGNFRASWEGVTFSFNFKFALGFFNLPVFSIFISLINLVEFVKDIISKKSVVLFTSCDNYRYYFKFIF